MATATRFFHVVNGPPRIDVLLCLYDYAERRQLTFMVEEEGDEQPKVGGKKLECRISSVTIESNVTFLLAGWAELGTAGAGTTERPIILTYNSNSRKGVAEINCSFREKHRHQFSPTSKGSAVIHVRSSGKNSIRFDVGGREPSKVHAE